MSIRVIELSSFFKVENLRNTQSLVVKLEKNETRLETQLAQERKKFEQIINQRSLNNGAIKNTPMVKILIEKKNVFFFRSYPLFFFTGGASLFKFSCLQHWHSSANKCDSQKRFSFSHLN